MTFIHSACNIIDVRQSHLHQSMKGENKMGKKNKPKGKLEINFEIEQKEKPINWIEVLVQFIVGLVTGVILLIIDRLL